MQQLSDVECGTACLAMILSYYGRKATLNDVRTMSGIGRDGSSARELIEIGNRLGLSVKGYSTDTEELASAPLPAIIHWRFNHFVVLERYSANRIVIVDPAVGRRRVAEGEFNEAFTGVLLSIEPGKDTRRKESGQSPLLGSIIGILRVPQIKGLMMQLLAASLLMQLLGLAVPLLTKVVIDYILPFNLTGILTVLGSGMLVWMLALAVTAYLRSCLLIYLRGKVDMTVMLGFFRHLLQLPLTFFQLRPTGDLLIRLASNTIVRETLTNRSLSVILDGLMTFFYLAILLTIDWRFGCILHMPRPTLQG